MRTIFLFLLGILWISNYAGAEMPSLCFSFAIITDTHIGINFDDYGTIGFNDDPSSGQEDEISEDLRMAVERINQMKDIYKIAFLVISGDISDSGEKSELGKAKEILDELQIPYVPVIGNHDSWPLSGPVLKAQGTGEEAEFAMGDRFFNEIFADAYKRLKNSMDNWDEGTRLTPIWNGEADRVDDQGIILKDAGVESYFLNFAFDYGGYHFIVLDWTSRDHAPAAFRGGFVEADIYNSDKCKGTFAWLREHLRGFAGRSDKIFILTHFPLITDLVTPFVSFTPSEYQQITELLKDYKDNLLFWIAGHLHGDRYYPIKTYSGELICKGLETGANWMVIDSQIIDGLSGGEFHYKPHSHIRIVQIFSDGSVFFNTILEGYPLQKYKTQHLLMRNSVK